MPLINYTCVADNGYDVDYPQRAINQKSHYPRSLSPKGNWKCQRQMRANNLNKCSKNIGECEIKGSFSSSRSTIKLLSVHSVELGRGMDVNLSAPPKEIPTRASKRSNCQGINRVGDGGGDEGGAEGCG